MYWKKDLPPGLTWPWKGSSRQADAQLRLEGVDLNRSMTQSLMGRHLVSARALNKLLCDKDSHLRILVVRERE